MSAGRIPQPLSEESSSPIIDFQFKEVEEARKKMTIIKNESKKIDI